MSASLVGSEMCIRDSASARSSHDGGRSSRRQAPLLGPESAPAPKLSYPCLLYTSDAADDM
eukprot:12082156-Alexandrium_andersonii.AAC.1